MKPDVRARRIWWGFFIHKSMSYINIDLSVHVDELMNSFSESDIEKIADWIKDNRPVLDHGNREFISPMDRSISESIQKIQDNRHIMTNSQAETIQQIAQQL